MTPFPSAEGVTDDGLLDRPPTILVVEDDDTLRVVLARELRKRGFSVRTVAGGDEAVEEYARSVGRIELVLMDVNMPGTSGPDALAALRSNHPGVRCCFMTADQRPTTRQALLARGALEVFGKPFESVARLCESLRRLSTRPAAGREPATEEAT